MSFLLCVRENNDTDIIIDILFMAILFILHFVRVFSKTHFLDIVRESVGLEGRVNIIA